MRTGVLAEAAVVTAGAEQQRDYQRRRMARACGDAVQVLPAVMPSEPSPVTTSLAFRARRRSCSPYFARTFAACTTHACVDGKALRLWLLVAKVCAAVR